jgi:TolB protein
VRFSLPSVSADGERLLVTKQSLEREVWRVPLGPDPDANGAAAVRLLDRSWDPVYIHVSGDGSTLLFNSNSTGSRNLWAVSLETTLRPRQIASIPGNVVSHTSLSWDAARVAYTSHQTGSARIWIMNADGSNAVQLTFGPGQDFWPSWSPDGKWIAFGSTRVGEPQIWMMPAAGGTPKQLSKAGGTRGEWSPVDRRYAYFTPGRVEIVDVDTGEILKRVSMPDQNTLPVWSPDGRYLSVVQPAGHRSDVISLVDTVTGEIKLAARFRNRFHMRFRAGWERDGKSLLANRIEIVSDIVLIEHFR